MKHTHPHIFLLYDSITNSVFSGQVLQPLLEQLANNTDLTVILISFEHAQITPEQIKRQIVEHPRLQIIILKKIPFIGAMSIRYAAYHLNNVLAAHKTYTLTARGPLAGAVALHAIGRSHCTSLIIQARGLIAHEYAYTRKNKTGLLQQLITRIRFWQFARLEETVYRSRMPAVTIEVVSPALGAYLTTTYGTDQSAITVAEHDIPPRVPDDCIQKYKTAVRTRLHICPDMHVYCYNGSAKAWQCPHLILSFFKQEIDNNKNVFLLILTDDTDRFKQLVTAANLDKTNYAIVHVPHTHIYQYLAAADTGIIFRESHIINWVSRPTKLLEYQAVGLNVLHNNTIAYAIHCADAYKK